MLPGAAPPPAPRARRPSATLALLLSALLVLAGGSTVVVRLLDERRTRPLSLDHGVSPGSGILHATEEELRRELDAMVAAGAGWLRVDLDWSGVEPERGQRSWDAVDQVVAAASERGMRIVALPTYTPAWARPAGTTDKHAPSDPEDFARFVGAAVERFAPRGVQHWEIWNEANTSSFWQPAPDPVAYGRLLHLASHAVRDADAEAVVLTTGTAPAADAPDGTTVAPVTFLETLYDEGLADAFDAVAHHPYSYPDRPLDPAPENAFLATTTALREVMVGNGDEAKEIWGTEFGVPNGGSRAVPESEQPAHLVEAFDAWLSWPYTGPLLWYSWRDSGTDADDVEQNFGLLRSDFSPKPVHGSFEAQIERWCSTRPSRCPKR